MQSIGEVLPLLSSTEGTYQHDHVYLNRIPVEYLHTRH